MSKSLPGIETIPAPEDVQFLEGRINDYNFETTGIHDGMLLSVFVRDEMGAIMAGVYGWTWGECCEVRFLWVRADQRGKDWGTRLLAAAEREAAERGCTQIVLSTHSFQAPEFYRRLGYQIAGTYDNYPVGHKQYFLCKPLSPARQV